MPLKAKQVALVGIDLIGAMPQLSCALTRARGSRRVRITRPKRHAAPSRCSTASSVKNPSGKFGGKADIFSGTVARASVRNRWRHAPAIGVND